MIGSPVSRTARTRSGGIAHSPEFLGWRSESERSFGCRHRRALRMRQRGPWDKDAVEVMIENLPHHRTSTATFI
jgi:hypothetical protein